MDLDDSSCDTVLILGLALYDRGTPPPVMSSNNGGYAGRRLQLKQEDYRQQPIVITDSKQCQEAPLEPSLTLALSSEAAGSYGVTGKGKRASDRPGQAVVDYQYSASSTLFPHHQQLLQYTSCHSLSLSSPSASTFSNSCLSSGAAVKKERVDAEPHRKVVTGNEAEEGDLDKALEAVPTSLHAGAAAAADGVDGDAAASSARKKLRLTKEQSALLEERFKEQSTLNPKQKLALAKQLNLRPRQVEVWFQNRRARTKLKQTEVDCEFLRRCCETLADENRRLHRELQELKAIKVTASASAATLATAPSPQSGLYQLQVPAPAAAAAAFTMCPGCQRISTAAGTDTVKQTAGTAPGFAVAPKAAHVM